MTARQKLSDPATLLRHANIPVLVSRLDLGPVVAEVSAQMKQVDRLIRAQAAEFDPALVGYIEYLVETRGKGIRPALAILAGGTAGGIGPDHLTLGTIVEMIHLASLVHDDILDRADTRRGFPTAQAKWGAEMAVLLGDSLFAQALRLCTRFETNVVARAVADAAHDVCQGEILQTQRQFDLSFSEEDYRKVIGMKTAALFSVATRVGAILSCGEGEQADALGAFGRHLGIAYQIYDDCLDLVGSEEKTGKTLGTDLEKGKLTLPVLMRLAEASGEELDGIRAVLLHGDPEQRWAFIAELHAKGTFTRATRAVRKELALGLAHLAKLPANRYRSALEQLASRLDAHLAEMDQG